METVALRLAYRPLRIGWCVRSGNWSDFDAVTRLSCTVWGGILGPIIPVGSHLADVFVAKFAVDVLYRADLAAPELSRFVERYPFLKWPFLRQDLFQMGHSGLEPAVMDVLPAIEAIGRLPKETLAPVVFVEEPTAALFEISDGDPLQHFILANFGGYPSPDTSGTNYAEAVHKHLGAERIPGKSRVPAHIENLWTPTQISRYGVTQQEVPRIAGANGIFAGAVDNFDDLVTFWNIRALGADIQFYDPREARLSEISSALIHRLLRKPSLKKFDHVIGVWCVHEDDRQQAALNAIGSASYPRVANEQWWSGIPIFQPPSGQRSFVLPTMTTVGRTELTFQLPARPFPDDERGHVPLVVLSIEPMGDFVETSDLTIWTPHIPALNSFYSALYVSQNSVRSSPGGFAVIFHQGLEIMTIYPLRRAKLLEEAFGVFGITARQSDAGRVTTRLIRQMGSILACAVFKLQGVRRLIARHSPLKSFERGAATKLIYDESGLTEGDSLDSVDDIYLGNQKLTANGAFDFLLARSVFRVGLELRCPHCTLEFWMTVDDVTSVVTCEYCGEQFAIAMQLKDRNWRYRRSGLFGKEDSQHGGIPVALAIHQLTAGIHLVGKSAFTPGMLLSSTRTSECETDLVLLVERAGTPKSLEIVVGECKSESGEITEEDVEHMAAIANAFPPDQIRAFIVFAKTGEFSREEIERCRTAQTDPPRVILLSRRELEPTFVHQRAAKQFKINETVISFSGLAHNTVEIFFDPKPLK